MNKIFRKIACLLAVLVVVFGTTATSFGASVTYENEADLFVFEPGSDYSLTDLFEPEKFKGVMPGDTIEDNITVRNNESDEYLVEIFMKATGSTGLVNEDPALSVTDEDSQAFLEQMQLTVIEQVDGYEDEVLFDAEADKTDGLTDWVSLGVFESGAEVNLKVLLTVPTEMGNDFQNAIGALDWHFKVQAYEVEEETTESVPPTNEEELTTGSSETPSETQTGDNSNMTIPAILLGAAALALIAVLFGRRRKAE